ncbi:response regulator [Salinispirillum sp. LH 10-3-1]|uniref:Response regulator n=1 Tax=Salinispirillum sp. LH 10-3-1 TaxID=2952525 RepID=A0AB38YFQ8_9GAMM
MAIKILVVDDASFIRDLIRRTVRSQLPEVDVEEAINGKRAQSLLNKMQFDLILCDWEMPEINGLQLLQWLRANEKDEGHASTPFIMVTSRGDKSHVVKAVEAGVTDYVGKPFTSEQLLRKVLKALSRDHREELGRMLGNRHASPDRSAGMQRSGAETLLAAGGTKAPANTPQAVAGSEAVSVLTGGAAAAKPAAEKVERVHQGRLKVDITADIRLADVTLSGHLEDVNLNNALIRLPRVKRMPQLFEQAVFDIALDHDGAVARLNGFVYSLQAADARFDCDEFLLNFKLTDEDPEKFSDLSRLIAKIR